MKHDVWRWTDTLESKSMFNSLRRDKNHIMMDMVLVKLK